MWKIYSFLYTRIIFIYINIIISNNKNTNKICVCACVNSFLVLFVFFVYLSFYTWFAMTSSTHIWSSKLCFISFHFIPSISGQRKVVPTRNLDARLETSLLCCGSVDINFILKILLRVHVNLKFSLTFKENVDRQKHYILRLINTNLVITMYHSLTYYNCITVIIFNK